MRLRLVPVNIEVASGFGQFTLRSREQEAKRNGTQADATAWDDERIETNDTCMPFMFSASLT